ncbi:MAG: ABC transporter ATP-binding protein [Longimicrobiales bacterium]|nr:ABC transporter ATP-binding protein [Longimicrobiales bacterium]
MAELRFEGVRKVFAGGTVAVDDVTLEVRDGEFMVFVGPSGSGKSTLLRVMAGLEAPTGGTVRVDGEDVTVAEPRERDLAMVFQAYALYPHKTVRENLEFGLRMRGVKASERRERAEAIARTLGIAPLLHRKPAELSGGQRQRVALGRALVREPKAFLLDEPLSNLDPGLRLDARAELARLHRKTATTFLYVTHDQEEAMSLGDRVAVLREGRVQQVAPPMELYRKPANRFVAEFIGSPSMNIRRCTATARGTGGGVRIEGPGFDLHLDDGRAHELPHEILLGIRPHDVLPVDGDEAPRDADGEIELVEPRGSDLLVRLRLTPEAVLSVVAPPDLGAAEGDRMAVRLPPDRLHFFDPRDGTRVGPDGAS